MLLGALESEQLKNSWVICGGIATLNSYRFGGDIDVIPGERIDFLRTIRNYYETETHIFVHANYEPHLPLAQQHEHVLRSSLLEGFTPEPRDSGKTVIVGHTAA